MASFQGVHPLPESHGSNPGSTRPASPFIDAMRDVAAEHHATVGQVALAWLVGYYGDTVIPIAGADRNRSPASASSEAAKPTG
jgi:aryl-alcohol dehydrogenase-like predicted oxidoreductase